MKELITIASSFIIVVGLALYMFVSNQSHSTAVKQNADIQALYEQQQIEIDNLKAEIEAINIHADSVDALYHKKIKSE